MQRQFNLVDQPWLKVIDNHNQEQKVSLKELMTNASQYRQLAGEMRSQDLAILRFLLAILTTVYSRVNAQNSRYKWLNEDYDINQKSIKNDLFNTWQALYRTGKFSTAVTQYLDEHKQAFDFFDEQHLFYQLTREQYDALVLDKNKIKTGTGTVAVKQINRTISESNNRPDIFAPKAPHWRNKVEIDELVRWLITYQNYTAVTDKAKTKAAAEESNSGGWLYELNPVFITGKNLFETLLLNMVLVPQGKPLVDGDGRVIVQKPTWEFKVNDYLQFRTDGLFPDNLAQLYTVWSRAIHIEWQDEQPIIYSAGLPKLDNTSAFLEPMTTWRENKDSNQVPAGRRLNSLGKAMWRNFGQYVRTEGVSDFHEPGIVSWLRKLKKKKIIPYDLPVHLTTIGLIKDGNATSQAPAAEFADELQINADVLFDENTTLKEKWPRHIEDTIELTNKVGKLVWIFAKNTANLKGVGNINDYANKISANFYSQLNRPFYLWLANLTQRDERAQKILEWKHEAYRIALRTAEQLMAQATPQEMRGKIIDDKLGNIFIYYRIFKASLNKTLFKG